MTKVNYSKIKGHWEDPKSGSAEVWINAKGYIQWLSARAANRFRLHQTKYKEAIELGEKVDPPPQAVNEGWRPATQEEAQLWVDKGQPGRLEMVVSGMGASKEALQKEAAKRKVEAEKVAAENAALKARIAELEGKGTKKQA